MKSLRTGSFCPAPHYGNMRENYTRNGRKGKGVLKDLGTKRNRKISKGQLRTGAVVAFFLLSGIFYGGRFGFSGEAFSMGREGELLPEALPAEGTLSAEDLLGKININTADGEELERLRGIGEKTAQAVIAYRAENGAFRKAEDIMEVPGIGEKTFEKIKDDITVE